MKKPLHIVAMVLLLLSLALTSTSGLAINNGGNQGEAHLISGSIVGKPVVVGPYIFWVEARNKEQSIYGYDFRKQANFLITDKPGDKLAVASDGKTVAWVEQPSGGFASIHGFDLNTSKEFTIIGDSEPRWLFGGLAVEDGVLYYQDGTVGHKGIYSCNIATKEERLVAGQGQQPVISKGILLWSTEKTSGRPGISEWSLHFRDMKANAKGSVEDKVIATGNGKFSDYNVSDGNIIWSFLPPAEDSKAYIYNVEKGAEKAISLDTVSHPIISGDKAVWSRGSSSNVDQPNNNGAIQVGNINDGSLATIVEDSNTAVRAWGITEDNTLTFTVDDPYLEVSKLYTANLAQKGLRFTVTDPTDTNIAANTCADTPPRICGQVYKSGSYFYDYGGRWPVKGVQFFLPNCEGGYANCGINTETMWDDVFNNSANNEKIQCWLDVASGHPAANVLCPDDYHLGYIGANTIRLFVQMGSSSYQPTTYYTIYRALRRASARNMRVGIVFYNNDIRRGWGSEQSNWLSGMFTYLANDPEIHLNWLPVIAYVSAENEINHYSLCGDNSLRRDCYDIDWNYIDQANLWVANFGNFFRSHTPRILTTVGIVTEAPDSDGFSPMYDYHKYGYVAANILKDDVDFLSPHNYGGAAYGLRDDIRNLGNYMPLVLEEYGFPTDPYCPGCPPPTSYYQEGDRYNPTPYNASYFVDVNTGAILTRDYEGGIAWMLADVTNKNCGLPGDYYTGLFASGSGYCGGTIITGDKQDKATAYRVQRFHSLYNP